MNPKRLVLTILAFGSVTMTACSDDDTSSDSTSSGESTATTAGSQDAESTAMVGVIAEALDAFEMEGALSFSAEQADCLAPRIVSDIGVDRLSELGADTAEDFSTLDWTPDEKALLFDELVACVDIEAQLTEFFASEGLVSDEVAACMAHTYAESDVLPEALFSREPDEDLNQRIDAVLSAAFASCA